MNSFVLYIFICRGWRQQWKTIKPMSKQIRVTLFISKQREGTHQPTSSLLVMHTATPHVERQIRVTWSLNEPL